MIRQRRAHGWGRPWQVQLVNRPWSPHRPCMGNLLDYDYGERGGQKHEEDYEDKEDERPADVGEPGATPIVET